MALPRPAPPPAPVLLNERQPAHDALPPAGGGEHAHARLRRAGQRRQQRRRSSGRRCERRHTQKRSTRTAARSALHSKIARVKAKIVKPSPHLDKHHLGVPPSVLHVTVFVARGVGGAHACGPRRAGGRRRASAGWAAWPAAAARERARCLLKWAAGRQPQPSPSYSSSKSAGGDSFPSSSPPSGSGCEAGPPPAAAPTHSSLTAAVSGAPQLSRRCCDSHTLLSRLSPSGRLSCSVHSTPFLRTGPCLKGGAGARGGATCGGGRGGE